MAYFMVMGGLLLSVSFTFGWILWRSGQWALGRLPGSKSAARRKQRPKRPATPKKATPRKAPASKAAASKATSAKAKPRKPAATRARKPAKPAEPWGLTVWLSHWRFAVPLSLLASLLYGLTRLAQFGMTQRPSEVPAGYHALVSVLGWAAVGLLGLAAINLLARWRCYRASNR
ncbi:hypothetical protein [Halomonas korlensis]|uniref:Uncharacterized protein n=1 Tax=Halomonas korlensis TaxID=463301 RepID=A0A1I7JU47_9GAMM|nr:hypothetical protein [Halomonas korlensis]SFU88731.1 hypothetical protein SAMN04487955_11271 [Halomonas korlensis]